MIRFPGEQSQSWVVVLVQRADQAYRVDRDMAAAVERIDAAAVWGPLPVEVLEWKSRLLLSLGRHAEARDAAAAVVEQEPDKLPEAWSTLVAAHLELNEIDAALTALQRAGARATWEMHWDVAVAVDQRTLSQPADAVAAADARRVRAAWMAVAQHPDLPPDRKRTAFARVKELDEWLGTKKAEAH